MGHFINQFGRYEAMTVPLGGDDLVLIHRWRHQSFPFLDPSGHAHLYFKLSTVCPGSSDPPEKIFNIFASEHEVYTIY